MAGLIRSISVVAKHASTCVDCDLLPQVIEAFKPGWVEENKRVGMVGIRHERSDDNWYRIVPITTLLDKSRMASNHWEAA